MRNVLSAALVFFLAPLHPTRIVAPSDACSLLTKGEIDGAMGVPMGNAKSITAKACQWRQPVKQGSPGAIVDVTIIAARGYNLGKAIAGSSKFKVVTVNALGDEAYYSESTDGKLTDLRVKKGENYVAIHVWGAGVPIPQIEPNELALAKAIIPKL
jgi:hypothetical protein